MQLGRPILISSSYIRLYRYSVASIGEKKMIFDIQRKGADCVFRYYIFSFFFFFT